MSETAVKLKSDPAFCLGPIIEKTNSAVKRNGQYFTKKWSEQKVLVIEVADLFMAGGPTFWPRKLIFEYVVAQCIYPKVILLPFVDKIIGFVTAGPPQR